jgi:hypothetical protein
MCSTPSSAGSAATPLSLSTFTTILQALHSAVTILLSRFATKISLLACFYTVIALTNLLTAVFLSFFQIFN